MKIILLPIYLYIRNNYRYTVVILCLFLSTSMYGQKIQTSLVETWTINAWQNSIKQTHSYDVNGHLIQTLSQQWDVATLSWKDATRSFYTNNPDGTADVVVTQAWDSDAVLWEDVQRTTYTYNASGKVLTSVTEIWLGFWLNSLKQTNTYDVSGYLTNNLIQTWVLLSSLWQNLRQVNYTNNPNGTVNQEISQNWDNMALTWNSSSRETFTYTAGNKILTSLTESISFGIIMNESMDSYTYDLNGNLTNTLSKRWDTNTSTWIDDTQSNFTHNSDASINQVISQDWSTTTSLWTNAERVTFTYAVVTWKPEVKRDAAYSIYPNPAQDRITVKSAKDALSGSAYTLTDGSGRQVRRGKTEEGSTGIELNGLPAGVYFLRLGSSPGRVLKVIKE